MTGWARYIYFAFLLIGSANAAQIFNVDLDEGTTVFPSNLSLYDDAVEYSFTIRNNSNADMANMTYAIPSYFVKDNIKTTCGEVLAKNKSCKVVFKFRPLTVGKFSDSFSVCAGNKNWCSKYGQNLDVSVTQKYIVTTNCSQIQTRPFADLTCEGSNQYTNNFGALIARVLNAEAVHREFYYYQHAPSVNETTTPCLQSKQQNANLDPNIAGGGVPLCDLMGYAYANASPTNQPADNKLAKLFPQYLNFLLATPYPVTPTTTPLSDLSTLLNDFATTSMDSLVQNVGYTGFVNFLTDYLYQQASQNYLACGTTSTCPTIAYLPYKLTSDESILRHWPISGINYWGMSGGGGGGAGYQIYAFKSGDTNHYTLYTGGGGGGGGNTTPEISNHLTYLLNVGSGGGGGSQFADCYVKDNVNLSGLGLGAGTGGGTSPLESGNIIYNAPPAVDYSYYPPNQFPHWSNSEILQQYGNNLAFLFETQIPELYEAGYTIVISGGGGGGAGFEFLNASSEEFTPQPVSIGSGFNFCFAFNKNGKYNSNDCISQQTINSSSAILNNLIYQNIGPLYNQGMVEAIKSANCNGYSNSQCTCKFQHAYVITNLVKILVGNGFSASDIPKWMTVAHCNYNNPELFADFVDINSIISPSCSPPWL